MINWCCYQRQASSLKRRRCDIDGTLMRHWRFWCKHQKSLLFLMCWSLKHWFFIDASLRKHWWSSMTKNHNISEIDVVLMIHEPLTFASKCSAKTATEKKKRTKSIRMWNCEAHEINVRIKSVGTSEKQRLKLKNKVFRRIVSSWPVMISLLTLARLPRAGSN